MVSKRVLLIPNKDKKGELEIGPRILKSNEQ